MVRTRDRRSARVRHQSFDWSFAALAGFLVLVALTGGAARGDVLSLVVLRPIAWIAAFVSLYFVSADGFRSVSRVAVVVLTLLVLVALQLVPLPAGLWTGLPGREPFAQVFELLGRDAPAHAISVFPARTLNSLFALGVPLAALLMLACVVFTNHRAVALTLVLIGGANAVLGLMQLLSSAESPLYLYRITNEGSAVGFFANRNHYAVFLACMFPLLAAYVASARQGSTVARYKLVILGVVTPFFLVSIAAAGSRAGLFLAGFAVLACLFVFRLGLDQRVRFGRLAIRPRYLVLAGVVAFFGLLMIASSRVDALLRTLTLIDDPDELRLQTLPQIWRMVLDFAPFGGGFGTFPDVYRGYEPIETLQRAYLNHAHNDLIEPLYEGGIPMVLIMVAGIWLWGKAAWTEFRRPALDEASILLRRAGLIVAAILAIASIVDYPLRVPMLASLFVIALVWSLSIESRSAERKRHGRDQCRLA